MRSRGRAARRPADLKAQIADEIYAALERLGADEELLAIVGSWRDTPSDPDVQPCCGTTMRLRELLP